MPVSANRRHCLQLLVGSASLALRPVGAAPARLQPWPANQPTPPLRATTLDGQPRTLNDYLGQPLLLNFWASYCAPCRLEMPQFNALLRQFQPQGLRILAVNHGEMPARVDQFLQMVPFDGQVLLDRSQTLLPAWGQMALPSSFLLDRRGRIQAFHVGELDWLRPDILADLQRRLA